VTWIPATAIEPPRVGYTVARRVGSAVVRNRLRRRLRAVARELAPGLAPGAYLISAAPEAVELAYGELRAKVSEAVTAIGATTR
jgi:ribonuclease P protein component